MRTTRLLIVSGLLALLLPALVFGADGKPKRAAFLQSLFVPGWGQYSLGKKNSALAFFGTEALLIGGMFTLRSYGALARDEYEAMAATYAGVVGDHDHDYYVDVGNWLNVDDYNEQRLQDRDFGELYTAESDRWEWDSDQHRAEMRNRRIKSDRAFNSVLYLIGGLVVNHVASAIHAGRASVRQSRTESSFSPPPWSVGVGPATREGGVRLLFTRSF